MKDETFNNKILDRIHKEKMSPRSRWYFMTERWFFMTLIVVAIIIGSVAVTTSVFILTDHDWFAIDHLQEGLFLHIIKTIPYLWIVIIAGVIAITYFNIKKVRRGYRYGSQKIIVGSLFLSIVLGTALFFAGVGKYLDYYFDHYIPSYKTLVSSNSDIWIYPEDGLLSGRIITASANSFTLIDIDEQPWIVATDAATQIDSAAIIPGKYVKIVGTMIDGSNFSADMVLPWSNERK